jgi:hypothetical protein
MQRYIIQRDKTRHIAVRVDDGQVNIFQRMASRLRSSALFLTTEEALTTANVIINLVQLTADTTHNSEDYPG